MKKMHTVNSTPNVILLVDTLRASKDTQGIICSMQVQNWHVLDFFTIGVGYGTNSEWECLLFASKS